MKRHLITALMLLSLAACGVREKENDAPRQTFTAVQESSSDSRTVLDGLEVVWSLQDAISIFSSSVSGGQRFDIDPAGAGTQEASFSGASVGAGPYYALYPADGAASLDGTTLSLSLPAVQQYAVNSFAPGSNPMVAASSGFSFQFRNLCGILVIRLTGTTTVKSLSITSNKAEALWGTASVAMDWTDVPALVMKSSADEAHRTVSLDCGSGVTLGDTPTEFNFVVPVGSLSEGFTLSVTDNEQGGMKKQTSNAVSIKRSRRNLMQALPYFQTESPFLSLETYGAYDLSASAPVAVKAYTKGTDQLALRSYFDRRTFRIQSLETRSALLVTTPASMEVGRSYQVKLESYGDTGIPDATVSAVLLKSEGGRLWLREESGSHGFIIAGSL